MNTTAEKSTNATSSAATQTQEEPFFRKQGGGGFFEGAKTSNAPVVQAKLTINEPGDVYEQEADKMADQVVQRLAMPGQEKEEPLSVSGHQPPAAIQTKCEACEEEEKLQHKEEEGPEEQEEIQRQTESTAPSMPGDDAGGDLASRLQASKGGGSPLPKDTRADMESAFGADFSEVRVHTDSEAHNMNESINAKAFTYGQDIYFKNGNFNPDDTEGMRLLAHELTHAQANEKKINRKIDNEANIKIVQTSLARDYNVKNKPALTGMWDDQTEVALKEAGLEQSDHDAILDYMFLNIAGESKKKLQQRIEQLSSVKTYLDDIEMLLKEAFHLNYLIAHKFGIDKDSFSLDEIHQQVTLTLENTTINEVSAIKDLVKIKEAGSEELQNLSRENMGLLPVDIIKSKEANRLLVNHMLKQGKKEEDLSGFTYNLELLNEMQKSNIATYKKEGDEGRSLELVSRLIRGKFVTINEVLYDEARIQELEYSGETVLKPYENIKTTQENIILDKQRLKNTIKEYNPEKYDEKIKEYNLKTAEYERLKKGRSSEDLEKIQNNIEILKKNIEIANTNKLNYINQCNKKIGKHLTELAFHLSDLNSKINSHVSLIKNEYDAKTNIFSDVEFEKRKIEIQRSEPQKYQMLVSLILDQHDVDIASNNVLSVHYDERVNALNISDITNLQKNIPESATLNGKEVENTEGKVQGVVLFEGGGQRTILLGINAFEDAASLWSVISASLNKKGPADSGKELPMKSVFGRDMASLRPQAVAANTLIWTDPRSIRIIQEIVNSVQTGEWDENTIEHIARWQKNRSLKKLKNERFGVFDENDLRSVFVEMKDKNRHNSLILLVLDFYNFYDQMSRYDDYGKLNVDKKINQEKRAVQQYDMLSDIHYKKDALENSEIEAAAAFDNPGLPTVVRMGENSMNTLEGMVSTLAHELIHVKQNESLESDPSPLNEIYAELMEISGTFGDISLPKKEEQSIQSDFFRAVKEYMRLDHALAFQNRELMATIADMAKKHASTYSKSIETKTYERSEGALFAAQLTMFTEADKILQAINIYLNGKDIEQLENIYSTFSNKFSVDKWPSTTVVDKNFEEAIQNSFSGLKSEIFFPISRCYTHGIRVDLERINEQIDMLKSEISEIEIDLVKIQEESSVKMLKDKKLDRENKIKELESQKISVESKWNDFAQKIKYVELEKAYRARKL